MMARKTRDSEPVAIYAGDQLVGYFNIVGLKAKRKRERVK